MRSSLVCLAGLAALSTSLAACGADESPGVGLSSPKTNAPSTGDGTTPTTDPAATAEAASCAGVADAKQIATEGDAADLRVTDGAVFYRTGTKIVRAAKDGSGKVNAYESPSLVRSFVADGGGVILTIEDPNQDKAVVKVISLEDPTAQPDPQNPLDPGKGILGNAEIATNWNAGGSYFIGADADAFYAVGDEEQGEVIYKFSRAVPVLQALVTVTDTISSAQFTGGNLWYVRDRTRIFEIAVTPDPNDPTQKTTAEPKEVFGSTASASCALAVGSDAAFCSAGTLIERRDLTGANPKTMFDLTKSKVAAPFGGATWFDGSLYVRNSAPDAKMAHAVRALKSNGAGVDERIVACGRSAIGEIAVDKDSVVWTEPGKGIFMAPR